MAQESTATKYVMEDNNERATQVGLFTIDTMEVLIDLTSSK